MKKNIAVIGSGISGLTAAYLLSKKHHVSVFEKAERIGGHTATKEVEVDGESYAIDTGFIVFNNKTYPNFLKLLSEIGVEKQETEMSFSVKHVQTGLEYNGHNLDTLFAQRRNFLNPKFWKLITEILKFNKRCKQLYTNDDFSPSQTLGEFLAQNHFSDYFCQNYILPMGAAIWSSSLDDMRLFPLRFFVRFFNHHGLLNISDRPQWYVIPKGSKSYLAPLTESFKDDIYLNQDIQGITRKNNKVQLIFENKSLEFDEVVIACHSDQALALLNDATPSEKDILGSLPYRSNDVVLHTDAKVLPQRRKAWASWNYQLGHTADSPASVTYNMNILQGLNSDTTFCVTLNQTALIDPSKILGRYNYYHPVYSIESLAAQQRKHEICGQNSTHFTGAYWFNGFHEDGVKSAVDVAQRLGCDFDG